MNILGIETSDLKMSVALLQDRHEVDEVVLPLKGSQSLLSSIDDLLKKYSSSIADLNAIAISEGPGSFTGLRIGVSLIKGWGLVFPIRVLPINSLEVWAYPHLERDPRVAVIINARRGFVYGQAFTRQNNEVRPLSQPYFGGIDSFLKTLPDPIAFMGNGVSLYEETIKKILGPNVKFLASREERPQAKCLVHLAAQKIAANNAEFINGKDLVPKYPWEQPGNGSRG